MERLTDSYIKDAVDLLGREATAEEIAAHFERLRVTEVAAAEGKAEERYRAGHREGWEKANAQNTLWAWIVGGAATVAAVWGFVWLLSADSRAHAGQMAACEAGKTLICMDAVADQQRNYMFFSDKDSTEAKERIRWHGDRVQLLRAAYRLKTGQELPAIGQEVK